MGPKVLRWVHGTSMVYTGSSMMTTFYFYDLETSGINPRDARIMQFAGQRTDMLMKPVGTPHNYLIKMTDDVVPDPDAVLITGITPQMTIADGMTEAEFLRIFHEEIATPGTIFVGYNTVRFDDEFMRYLHYRNFYDPYEWQYLDGKSRWDLLDVVRMTRALRPDGIQWPVDSKGAPTNRLELLTSLNGIEHTNAHDALSDVHAVIAVARMIQQKQPKLFDYLLRLRDKKEVAQLAQSGQPFLYSSGKYASEWQKTTAVARVADHPKRQGSLVFDLRNDPAPFAAMTPAELAAAWSRPRDDPGVRLPVKTLQYNRCPAVAPLSVLDAASAERLQLDQAMVRRNYQLLMQHDMSAKLLQALELLDNQQGSFVVDEADVDAKLYDGFFGDADRTKMSVVRAAATSDIADLGLAFKDARLQALLPLYKARNYRSLLSDEDRQVWERFRERRLMGGKQASRMARYFARLAELSQRPDLSAAQHYLLEELQLYGQSIMPVDTE